jgi:hypothetical protein
MPAPNKVARKLSESLGSDAGDAMVDWMNQTEENTRELRADISELQHKTLVEFAQLRQETTVRFAELRSEMNTRFAELREETRSGFAAAEATGAKRHADFMKWTMGFWAVSLVTLVGAIATLSRMLP